jgi:hypothetical protein
VNKVRVKSKLFSLLTRLSREFIFFIRFAKPRWTEPKITTECHNQNLSNLHKDLIVKIQKALKDAKYGALLPYSVRIVKGMSGQRFRVLLNNLAQIANSGSYLEVGTFKGSTAVSALYKNKRSAILVDNWSEFGGPKNTALINFSNLCPNSKIRIIDTAFETFYSMRTEEKIALYFYDGGHSIEQQKRAVTIIDSLNFDLLIFIVDDFDWETVREGTFVGLSRLRSKLVQSWIISPAETDRLFQYGNWHNGYLICVVSKH